MAPRRLSVEAAARRDLAALPPLYRDSALGRTYLLLARRLDAGVSTRDAGQLAREMRQCLLTLHTLSPPKEKADPADEVGKKREERMAREAAAGE